MLALFTSAAKELSEHYRRGDISSLHFRPEHYTAYAATRMPATLAVLRRVFEEIKDWDSISTVLDIGAGPGTSLQALSEFNISHVTLIEKEHGFIELGKKLETEFKTTWLEQDITRMTEFPKNDLVMASYSLGELKQSDTVKNCIKAAQKLFVAVEPGTPKGYRDIIRIRDELITQKFHIVAPCPHSQVCPMTGADWCHFSERLQRSREHRQVKRVQLNYEDEKYSYVIASRSPVSHSFHRIIRRPMKRPGHIILDLCTSDGLQRKIISKSDKENMRFAKKKEWGDVL